MSSVKSQYETLICIANQVRKLIEKEYGDYLAGKCIRASELIVDRLKELNIPAWTVEGWCLYDNFEGCSNAPYDAHTWAVADLGKTIYIDVTATQFQPFIGEDIPNVIVGERPRYMLTKEPDDELLENIGW